MFIKPAAGLLVRDPHTRQPLHEAGEEKPDTAFWLRRLRDGDVAPAEAPATEHPA